MAWRRRFKRKHWLLLGGFAEFLAGSEARAQTEARLDVADEHVIIDFGNVLPAKPKAWVKACKALGSSLSVGQGPWGMGAFQSYSCVKEKQEVFGKPATGRRTWRLNVASAGDGVTLAVDDGLSSTPAARMTLAASPHLAQVLSDPELAHLVAFTVLDMLPMAMAVRPEDITSSKDGGRVLARDYFPAKKGPKKPRFKSPDPPEALSIYGLAWSPEKKVWRPSLVGTAKRLKLEQRTVTYGLDEGAMAALAKGPLWAQNANGRAVRSAELTAAAVAAEQAIITQKKGKAKGKLAQSLASGYVGIRYGLQLARGDPLISKTRFFGLLVEIRGGPVGGLRYYYDKLPATTVEQPSAAGSSVETSIDWSRHLLGYSFGFNPGILVDQISITPKIGVWTFDATLPVATDDDGTVLGTQRFHLGRALSAGVEVGVEWMSGSYTVRPWAGIDSGFSLLKNGGTATSRRVGLDAFFAVGPALSLFGAPIKIALLGFVLGESVLLSDPGATGNQFDTVYLDSGYAGGGVAASW